MVSCKQTGVALITVLLVVALASFAATSLATLQQVQIRRSTVLLHQQQAKQYVLGAEQWAAQILARDRQNSSSDDLSEDWASTPPALPVTGGFVSGVLQDLQARFNLNNLIKDGVLDENQFAILQRLLDSLDLNPGLALAIADWIDADQDIRFADGAEDSEYLGRTPAYLAANQPLLSISELRLVKGFDADVYAALAPYVSALPAASSINVNTAVAPVLAALAEELDLLGAEELVNLRQDQPFVEIADFIAAADIDATFPANTVTLASDFFLLQAQAQVGAASADLHSVLFRDSGTVKTIRRHFGQAE